MRITSEKNAPRCVECGAMQNGAMALDQGDERTPIPGDFTMCLYCGTCQVFAILGGCLILRPMTEVEKAQMMVDYQGEWERGQGLRTAYFARENQ